MSEFNRDACKKLSTHSSRNMCGLLEERYDPKFRPEGFIVYFNIIELYVKSGYDRYNISKRITPSDVYNCKHEKVAFARILRGEKFAEEVNTWLNEL